MTRPRLARTSDKAAVLQRFRSVIDRVPRGRVITYGQVAAAAGSPGAARVTVWVLRTESHLPWHRVVAAGGRIALPGEDGREQRLRLELEGVAFRGDRVRMDLHGWVPWRARRPRTRRPRPVRSRGLPRAREEMPGSFRGADGPAEEGS